MVAHAPTANENEGEGADDRASGSASAGTEPTVAVPRWRRVRLACEGAEAVYLMGAFNGWSTTRTPMQRIGVAGWEAWVPGSCPGRDLRLFVWEPGRRHGRLMHVLREPAPPLDAARR